MASTTCGSAPRSPSRLATVRRTSWRAAIGAGMDYLADDYCLVDAQPPYQGYRLFNTAKMGVDSSVQPNWIAGLEREMEPVSGGKRIFNLTRHSQNGWPIRSKFARSFCWSSLTTR
jgi:hypothetical protein